MSTYQIINRNCLFTVISPAASRGCEPIFARFARKDGFFVQVPKRPSLSTRKTEYKREFRLWRISIGLTLTSELDALCAEDANPYLLASLTKMGSLCEYQKGRVGKRLSLFGTRNGNRTHNYPLGGGYYIHLTMQAYYIIITHSRGICNR